MTAVTPVRSAAFDERFQVVSFVSVDGKLIGNVEPDSSAATQYVAKVRACALSKRKGFVKVEVFDRMAKRGCKQLWRYENGVLLEESYREVSDEKSQRGAA